MLNLHAPTPRRWLDQVAAHLEELLIDHAHCEKKAAGVDEQLFQMRCDLEELLIDHAHCEKKAAGVAMNLLFAYVDEVELVRALSGIVQEELSHFHLVLDLLEKRNIRFRKIPPSRY